MIYLYTVSHKYKQTWLVLMFINSWGDCLLVNLGSTFWTEFNIGKIDDIENNELMIFKSFRPALVKLLDDLN